MHVSSPAPATDVVAYHHLYCSLSMVPLVSPELLLQKSEMDRRAKEIASELRKARRDLKRASKACSEWCWQVALSILCFSKGDTTASCKYAVLHHHDKHEPAALLEQLQAWWAGSTEADHRARTDTPNSATTREAAKRAHVFLTDLQLHEFVTPSHLNLGVAPVTATVLNEVHHMQGGTTEPAACLLKRGASCKSMKWRHRRWRCEY